MNKNIKYLLLSSVLFAFIFIGQTALAETNEFSQKNLSGGACGASSQGICKSACAPYDEIIDSTTSSGQSTCIASEMCCVSTKCSLNTSGIGTCKSSGSCAYGSVGIYTSDCTPPSVCCVVPNTAPGVNTSGTEVNLPSITPTSGTNVFTNDQTSGTETTGGNTSPLVPCEGFDCSLCSFFTLIKNIINLLIELTFAFAGGFIVWGAIEIMIAGGDEKKVSEGRGRITVAIYGVAISLGAWLIVGTLLQILTNSSSVLPWNKIECSSSPLNLAPVQLYSDSACINKGGYCQDSSAIQCAGTYTDGCNASSRNNKNVKCCVLDKNPLFVDIKKDEAVLSCSELSKRLDGPTECVAEAVAGTNPTKYVQRLTEGSCPSGLYCYQVKK